MQNLRWGITAAIFALLLSVGLGIISGVSIFHIFIRAFIFTVLFFGLGLGLKFVVDSFFPELLFMDEGSARDDYNQPGSRINITVDNTGEYAVPELYKAPSDPDELGNIEDLISGAFKVRSAQGGEAKQAGIDRKREEGYNVGRGQSVLDQEPINFNDMFNDTAIFEKHVFTPSFGDGSEGLGGLPDLDAMATAFSPTGGPAASVSLPQTPSKFGSGSPPPGVPQFSSGFEEAEPQSQSRYVGNKPQPLKGDFNPKELAEGIRTVLSKEK